jgi:hypothetical protein
MSGHHGETSLLTRQTRAAGHFTSSGTAKTGMAATLGDSHGNPKGQPRCSSPLITAVTDRYRTAPKTYALLFSLPTGARELSALARVTAPLSFEPLPYTGRSAP